MGAMKVCYEREAEYSVALTTAEGIIDIDRGYLRGSGHHSMHNHFRHRIFLITLKTRHQLVMIARNNKIFVISIIQLLRKYWSHIPPQ